MIAVATRKDVQKGMPKDEIDSTGILLDEMVDHSHIPDYIDTVIIIHLPDDPAFYEKLKTDHQRRMEILDSLFNEAQEKKYLIKNEFQ